MNLILSNLKLKFKNFISTFFEILIPCVLLVLTLFFSNNGYSYTTIFRSSNSPEYDLESEFILSHLSLNLQFYFPTELNSFKKEFLTLFKSNHIFHDCAYNKPKEQEDQCEVRVKEYKTSDKINSEPEKIKEEKNSGLTYSVLFTSETEYTIRYSYENKNSLFSNFFSNGNPTAIQYAIDKTITAIIAPSIPEIKIKYKIMDREGSTIKDRNISEKKISLFMVFYFSCCSVNLFSYLVQERESANGSKRKNPWIVWVSWGLIYGILIFIYSIGAAIVLSFFKVLMYTPRELIFFFFILYGISCCNISILLSTKVNSSRIAFTISKYIVLSFLGSYHLFIYLQETKGLNHLIQWSGYFFSPISFLQLLHQLITMDNKSILVSYQSLLENKELFHSIMGLMISSMIMILLAIYLEKNNLSVEKNENQKKESESLSANIKKKNNSSTEYENETTTFSKEKQISSEEKVKENENEKDKEKNTEKERKTSSISHHETMFSLYLLLIKYKFKSYFTNEKIFVLNILLPICCIVVIMNYVNKLDLPDVLFKEINPSIYSKKTQFSWFKDSHSSSEKEITTIINEIENIIPLKEIDYNKELTLKSEENVKSLNRKEIFVGGFKGILDDKEDAENNNSLEMILYFNETHFYSFPIIVNIIDNALLHSHSSLDKDLVVHYKGFKEEPELYSEEDKDHWINIKYPLNHDIYDIIVTLILSLLLSYSISCFGSLTVKDRMENIPQQFHSKGLTPLNYWIGVLLSDTFYMMIPILGVHLLGNYFNLKIFHIHWFRYTLGVSILWVISSLLFQYIICYSFKNYHMVYTLSSILIPLISFSFFVLNYTVLYTKGSSSLLIFIGLSIIKLSFAPGNMLLMLYRVLEFMSSYELSFQQKDIDQFLQSKKGLEILEKMDFLEEKKKLITETFLSERRFRSLTELLKNNNYYVAKELCIIISFIFLYLIILHLLNSSKFKKENKSKNE